MNITIKKFIWAAKLYYLKGRNFRGTNVWKWFKNCEFRGTYFCDWMFIENFTEFIFAMDRFERLQREIMKK